MRGTEEGDHAPGAAVLGALRVFLEGPDPRAWPVGLGSGERGPMQVCCLERLAMQGWK